MPTFITINESPSNLQKFIHLSFRKLESSQFVYFLCDIFSLKIPVLNLSNSWGPT